MEAATNDIDIKMIEFFNLNPSYYQNIHGIEEMDFFQRDKKIEKQYQGENGKLQTSELGKTAHDIIEIKREVKKEEEKEKKRTISNIAKEDPLNEIVFKMFEQVKSFNQRLSDLTDDQKDTKQDLDKLEM